MKSFWVAARLILGLALAVLCRSQAPTPVLLWHGMGDTCCNPLSMGRIQRLIELEVPGINVTSLQIGNDSVSDFNSGFFINVNDQLEEVCDLLQTDPIWANGYNAVGFSQGGLFFRSLAERCPSPPMVNCISIGGPQQGIFGLPKCPGYEDICDEIRDILNNAAYDPLIQENGVQAEYWHDPLNEELYNTNSIYLADINNELGNRTDVYRENLVKLNNLVLVLFTEDTVVQPRESEWFGFYYEGQAQEVYNVTDSALYTEDWIGLKELDEAGKLQFLSTDGDHLDFTDEWFIENIVDPYLKP